LENGCDAALPLQPSKRKFHTKGAVMRSHVLQQVDATRLHALVKITETDNRKKLSVLQK